MIFTVNLWSPTTILSRFTPFNLHPPIKKLFWSEEEEDAFPVKYLMNPRAALRNIFQQQGFQEAAFPYLDDLAVFGRFFYMNSVELQIWKMIRKIGMHYPENCL